MTPEEKEALEYRFSGYQLPMIQLDATGDAYVHLTYPNFPHPYYRNQPEVWLEPAYSGTVPVLNTETTADFLFPLIESGELD